MTVAEFADTIKQRSACNEEYRPGGTLVVAESNLRPVLLTLLEKDLVETDDVGDRFSLTSKGKQAVKGMERKGKKSKNSKEKASTELLSILVSHVRNDPQRRYVLDVGTGDGYLAFKVADLGFKVLGIDSSAYDYSKNSINKATEKARANPKLEFQVADVRDIKGEDVFDFVVSSQATHCMKDQRGCICAIHRLLKRGGLLIVSDFSVGLKGFFAHGFHSFLALSKEEWMDALGKCGYVNLGIHEIQDYCVVEAQKPTRR